MGRPLNKRLFGEPTAAGSEIKVNFHNGSAVKEGYIVKQKGSKKFVCEEIDREYLARLTAKAETLIKRKIRYIIMTGEEFDNYKDSLLANQILLLWNE